MLCYFALLLLPCAEAVLVHAPLAKDSLLVAQMRVRKLIAARPTQDIHVAVAQVQ